MRSSSRWPSPACLVLLAAIDLAPGAGGLAPRHAEQLAGLGDAGGAATKALGDLASLRDQLPVRLRHLPVRQVEVVLQPGAGVATEGKGCADQLPLVAGDADHLPLVLALGAAGDLIGHEADVAGI